PLQTRSLPRMWDYQGWVVAPLGRGTLEVRALGAGDRVTGRTFDRASGRPRTTFEFDSQFHRADLVARWRAGRLRFLLTPSFRYQSDAAEQPMELSTVHREYATSLRAEAEL